MADGTHGEAPASLAIPSVAALVGYAGALPFVIAATTYWLSDQDVAIRIQTALVAYGAVVLSFLGGVRWGFEIFGTHPGAPRAFTLTIATLPAIAACGALLIDAAVPQLAILAAAYLGLLLSDVRAARAAEAPAWYPGLRVPLTVTVEVALAAAIAKLVIGWESPA